MSSAMWPLCLALPSHSLGIHSFLLFLCWLCCWFSVCYRVRLQWVNKCEPRAYWHHQSSTCNSLNQMSAMIKWKIWILLFSLLVAAEYFSIFFFFVAAYACVACGNNSSSKAYMIVHLELECDLWCTTRSASIFSRPLFSAFKCFICMCQFLFVDTPHDRPTSSDIVQRSPKSHTKLTQGENRSNKSNIEYATLPQHRLNMDLWLAFAFASRCSQCAIAISFAIHVSHFQLSLSSSSEVAATTDRILAKLTGIYCVCVAEIGHARMIV